MDEKKTQEVFLTVALFAHGYASIIANNALEYDEALIAEHSGELLAPPCEKCAGKLAALNWKEQSFRLHAEEDLVIPGIGWTALYSGACTVTLRTPDFVSGLVRPWLIPSPARRRPGKRNF